MGFCEKDRFAVKSYRAMYNTERKWFGYERRKKSEYGDLLHGSASDFRTLLTNF